MIENHPSLVSEPQKNADSKYDAVLVFGGNIRKTPRRFSSTNFHEGPEKSIGAHSRTRAASELYKNGESNTFIVSTGKTHPDSDAPTEAQVMKEEMIRYGVPAENIIKEEISSTTFTNIEEMIKIIKDRKFKKVAALSSSWHLGRVKTMFDSFHLENEEIKTSYLSSEKILLDKSQKFLPLIKKIYNRPTMRTRIDSEQQGIRDFNESKYQPKPLEYTPCQENS